jgi:sterol desaturase/sphingolipid hydroxylase (fatty acid hydroxylase superfamily)
MEPAIPLASRLLDALAGAVSRLAALVIDPASEFSLVSLLSAFCIAAAFLVLRRKRKGGIRFAALVRALLPREWRRSRSVRADISLLLVNLFVSGALLGWTIVSGGWVAGVVGHALAPLTGPEPPLMIPRAALAVVLTVTFWIAYEASYYADHWLKHKVPVLWQFHRVHHSAEALTPLTNARIHPVDEVIYANITAIGTGTAMGVVTSMVGTAGAPLHMPASNAIMLVALYLILHLHHSHVWIAFTGTLGRLVLSPAHHQLHHSTDPRHFNRNFGATLAIFDRMAGTLMVPTREREYLRFGAGPHGYDPHSMSGLLLMPFADAAGELKRSLPPQELPVQPVRR